MAEQKVASLIQFGTLDDFVDRQDNYWAHFLDDVDFGQMKREHPYFKRFQAAHPEMERQVTEATVRARRAVPRERLPYEQLWETYKLMSKLVFVDDKDLQNYGQSNPYFLTR